MKKLPKITSMLLLEPSKPFYEVVDHEMGVTFNLDVTGGETLYGAEDWDLAVNGFHPGLTVRAIQVTLH